MLTLIKASSFAVSRSSEKVALLPPGITRGGFRITCVPLLVEYA